METPQYLSDFKCVLYFQNKLSAVIFLFHSKLLKSLINQMNLDQFGGKILFSLYVLLNESLPVKRYYVIQANGLFLSARHLRHSGAKEIFSERVIFFNNSLWHMCHLNL